MLIEFSVGNYRSIKDIQTLSFVATSMKEHEETHTFQATDKIRLLKSVGIYGANGSGKSNLIRGLSDMIYIIKRSFQDETALNTLTPFLLEYTSTQEPIFLQLVFIVQGKKYRYGFNILNGEVASEWLFGTATSNEVEYFTREKNLININPKRFKEGKSLESKTSNKNLFLNICHAFNGEISSLIKSYLEKIAVISGLEETHFRPLTIQLLKDPDMGINSILEILKIADFGIEGIALGKKDEIFSIRKQVKNGSTKDLLFHLDSMESEGTKKLFDLSVALFSVTTIGLPLIIDEFDARFHPILTRKIVQLFNSSANKSNAQLLFVTHDTNLLDGDLLRRDQIYFVEKDSTGASHTYSLSDFKGVRNDASFEKDYIKGKYGAIPYVGDFSKIFKSDNL